MTPQQEKAMLQQAIESLPINERERVVGLDRKSWTTLHDIVQPTYVDTYYACGCTTVTFSHLGVIFSALEPNEVQRAKD